MRAQAPPFSPRATDQTEAVSVLSFWKGWGQESSPKLASPPRINQCSQEEAAGAPRGGELVPPLDAEEGTRQEGRCVPAPRHLGFAASLPATCCHLSDGALPSSWPSSQLAPAPLLVEGPPPLPLLAQSGQSHPFPPPPPPHPHPKPVPGQGPSSQTWRSCGGLAGWMRPKGLGDFLLAGGPWLLRVQLWSRGAGFPRLCACTHEGRKQEEPGATLGTSSWSSWPAQLWGRGRAAARRPHPMDVLSRTLERSFYYKIFTSRCCIPSQWALTLPLIQSLTWERGAPSALTPLCTPSPGVTG